MHSAKPLVLAFRLSQSWPHPVSSTLSRYGECLTPMECMRCYCARCTHIRYWFCCYCWSDWQQDSVACPKLFHYISSEISSWWHAL